VVNIGYRPCTKDGNTDEDELPEEFIVESADEIVGLKDLFFKVYIKDACGLPKGLSTNPFVTY